jgi:hypothetical protein
MSGAWSAKSFGKFSKLSELKEQPMPAIPAYIIDPIWEQFEALLPEGNVDHPLGCHNPRIPDRVLFEKLGQVLVFGSAPTSESPRRVARRPPSDAGARSGSTPE